MTAKKSGDGLRKTGTSRRLRTGKGKSGGTPRIMILAVLLVAAAAAFLFWPKGGGSPAGIGEHRSVVTAPAPLDSSTTGLADNRPRSNEVDINEAEVKVVPEEPRDGHAVREQTPPDPAPSKKPAQKPAQKATIPPAQKVQPSSEGRWAVQTGGFGKAENADQEAARLQKTGWNAIVMAGSNNQGRIVYRVWIGYFPSRDEAQLFLNQNKDRLSDAFVVHR